MRVMLHLSDQEKFTVLDVPRIIGGEHMLDRLIIEFDKGDIIRHRLVRHIVGAYERDKGRGTRDEGRGTRDEWGFYN